MKVITHCQRHGKNIRRKKAHRENEEKLFSFWIGDSSMSYNIHGTDRRPHIQAWTETCRRQTTWMRVQCWTTMNDTMGNNVLLAYFITKRLSMSCQHHLRYSHEATLSNAFLILISSSKGYSFWTRYNGDHRDPPIVATFSLMNTHTQQESQSFFLSFSLPKWKLLLGLKSGDNQSNMKSLKALRQKESLLSCFFSKAKNTKTSSQSDFDGQLEINKWQWSLTSCMKWTQSAWRWARSYQ